jgi:hypothetical protein
MAFSLLAGALRVGTAANKPTVPDAPAELCQLYFESDTGVLNIGVGGAAGWRTIGGSTAGAQPTPTAKTADFTATVAELLTRIITATKASAVAATLPLGTDTDAGFFGGLAKVGDSFEWSLINLGSSSGAVTMTANTGHTYVGAAVVAIATSARFRTVKTATGTFITYRVS